MVFDFRLSHSRLIPPIDLYEFALFLYSPDKLNTYYYSIFTAVRQSQYCFFYVISLCGFGTGKIYQSKKEEFSVFIFISHFSLYLCRRKDDYNLGGGIFFNIKIIIASAIYSEYRET